MRYVILAALGFLGVALALNGCNDEQPVVQTQGIPQVQQGGQVVPQVAPVVVQQPAPSDSGFFTGMLFGHLLGGGGTHTQTIIHDTSRTYVSPPRTVYSAPRTTYIAPRSSFFSSTRTTTFSAPSFRPSFSARPSFGGGRR